MKRFLLGLVAAGLVVAVAAVSGQKVPLGDLQVQVGDRNPWTHLRINNDPSEFQFAVVSDRTGGHRPTVFSRAVKQINLLQPEFVLSVGDLIEGYTQDKGKLDREWKEFQSYTCQLDMPFFYVPGNHDTSNATQADLWQERFGRRYYHFVYKDVLFLFLNSNEPYEIKDPPCQIGPEQLKYVEKTLEENRFARWTVICLHKPIWALASVEKTGWLDVERLLNGRNYTVFAGHVHRYQKFIRNGMNYYQLATTGGGSRMRGLRYGEFDHIVWVTMKKSGPVLANVMLDGVLPEDLHPLITDEPGVSITSRRPTQPVKGKAFFEGTPVPNAQVAFFTIPADKKVPSRIADCFVEPDGTFVPSSYNANDGLPAGDYIVTIVLRHPHVDAQGKPGVNLLPERYAKPDSSELRVKIKDGANDVVLELKK